MSILRALPVKAIPLALVLVLVPAYILPGIAQLASPQTIDSPHTPEPTNVEERQLIDDLIEQRIVLLQGEIDHQVAEQIITILLYLDAVEPGKDIYLYINSPGGRVAAAMAIYNTMSRLESDVVTINANLAASMGAFLLAAGTKGKRFALAGSKVLIHQPFLTTTSGQVANIESREVFRIRRQLNQLFAHHTGQTLEKIESDTQVDYVMSAQEARDYGLVDWVIDRPMNIHR